MEMNQQLVRSHDTQRSIAATGGVDVARFDCAQTIWFVLLNALMIAVVAALHPFSHAADLISGTGIRSYVGLVCLECGLLFIPAIVSSLLFIGITSGVGNRIAKVWTILMSLAYCCDLILYLTIHEHLWSRVTFALASSVLPSVWWYVSFREVGIFIFASCVWASLQWICWRSSGMLARYSLDRIDLTWRESALALGCLVAVPVLFASPALRDFTATLDEIRMHADRHPLGSLGWFPANATPQYLPGSDASVRGKSLMLSNFEKIEWAKSQYQQIAILPDSDASEEGRSAASRCTAGHIGMSASGTHRSEDDSSILCPLPKRSDFYESLFGGE